jgi:hypothetical protein
MRGTIGSAGVLLLGFGQSVSGIQSPFIGFVLMGLGGLGCAYFVLSHERIRAYVSSAKIKQGAEARSLSTTLLGELQDDLRTGRQLLASISVPEYAMDHLNGSYLRIGWMERDIRAWAHQVRSRIETAAPELLAAFDQGADLPAGIVMIGLEQSVSRTQMFTFLEAKLHNLEQIIASQYPVVARKRVRRVLGRA